MLFYLTRRMDMRESISAKLIGMTFAAALLAAAATARAQDFDDYGDGYGPYGMGPGMMWGGYGMGPGMMGGYGGYGMGPGMMGMGPGMMGGYGMGMMGMGPGMMWGYDALNLTDEQRAKIEKILDAERKQHWSVMGKMLDEQNKLRDLYAQETPDPKKVGAVYGEMAKLRQQMIEAHVQASNEVQQVLTKEQREQLRQWNRGGWGWGPRGPAAGRPGAPGPGMMR
jgi:Spy/CpxP family protein refolding chaperone